MRIKLTDPDFGIYNGAVFEGVVDRQGDFKLPPEVEDQCERSWALAAMGEFTILGEENVEDVMAEAKLDKQVDVSATLYNLTYEEALEILRIHNNSGGTGTIEVRWN